MSIWTKDQHFIPQSYLRLFSHDQKNIWVYDKTNNSIKSQRIKDTGFIKWFYLSRLHPAPLDISQVSSLEGKAKTIIQKIEKRELVTSEELGQLLNFVTLQFLRTPAARKRADASLNAFWKELRKIYRVTKPEGKKKAEQIAKDFINDQNLKLTPKVFLENDDYITAPQEFFPETIPALGQKLMENLANQGWEFLSAEEGEFLTSDDPFSLAKTDIKEYSVAFGKESYKIIPLSKKMCMVIGGNTRPLIIKKMLPWAIRVINLNMANTAEQYVYSSNQELLEEVIADLPAFKKNPDSFSPTG